MRHGFRARRTESREARSAFYERWIQSRTEVIHTIKTPMGMIVSKDAMDALRKSSVVAYAATMIGMVGTNLTVSEHLPIRRVKPGRAEKRRHWVARNRR